MYRTFKFKNSLVFKQWVVFSIIIIINIAGILSVYNLIQKNVRNQIEDRLVIQNEYFLDDLENEVNRIQQLQHNSFASKYLVLLNSKEEALSAYDKREALLLLQERALTIQLSNKYIEKVTIYMNEADTNVTSKEINATTNLEKQTILDIIKIREGKLHFYKDKVYIVATNYQSPDYKEIPSLVILVELSKEKMIETLNQIKSGKESGAIVLGENSKWYFEDFMGEVEKSIASQFKEREVGEEGDVAILDVNENKYVSVHSDSEILGIGLIQFYPYGHVFASLHKGKVFLWILLIVICIIMLLFSIYTNKVINKPLLKLHHAFECVEQGNLEIRIKHYNEDEFGYIYTRFNEMLVSLNKLIKQVTEYENLVQRSELKQLQAQINPHFLYNSFFALSRRIKREDNKGALIFTEQLGSYFKFITRNEGDEVDFINEVEHAKSYANIQAIRFRGRIEVDFEKIPPKFEDILVPRLIVQPIIENAFEHSLENKEADGLLKVSFKESRDGLDITIEDNGDSLLDGQIKEINNNLQEDMPPKEITGLVNIHRRLKIFFKGESGLYFNRSDLGGLSVLVKIDLRERGKDV